MIGHVQSRSLLLIFEVRRGNEELFCEIHYDTKAGLPRTGLLLVRSNSATEDVFDFVNRGIDRLLTGSCAWCTFDFSLSLRRILLRRRLLLLLLLLFLLLLLLLFLLLLRSLFGLFNSNLVLLVLLLAPDLS